MHLGCLCVCVCVYTIASMTAMHYKTEYVTEANIDAETEAAAHAVKKNKCI